MILKEKLIKIFKNKTIYVFKNMEFLKELYEKRKNDHFQSWLNKDIYDNKKNKDVVFEMANEINIILKSENYKIKNQKQFKNELASYIYRESI